ncbi:MAG TPA: ATP-dependent Clp protease adaptor ClpS [Chloroflexota bacterium]|nr:ATP-dependent Clp protease adaptor ClpS [Chloroflexota bacterium]
MAGSAVWSTTETPVVPKSPSNPDAPAQPGLPGIAPDQDQEIRRRVLRPYKVVLHNDEHNSMEHVVESLRKAVPGMTLGKATAIMWEAHTAGKAVVISCPLELAELYQQRILSFGLTATIEKD